MYRARRECCQNDSPQNVIDTPYIKEMEKTSHRQPYIELYMKHYRKQVYLYTTGKHNYSIDTKKRGNCCYTQNVRFRWAAVGCRYVTAVMRLSDHETDRSLP